LRVRDAANLDLECDDFGALSGEGCAGRRQGAGDGRQVGSHGTAIHARTIGL
jgi:hypothetical protein